MKRASSYQVCGVRIDALDIAAATERIIQQATVPTSPAGYVAKPYVEFLDRTSRDKRLAKLLNDSFLTLADGIAVSWSIYYLYGGPHRLSRLFSSLFDIVFRPARLLAYIPERIGGINFTWPLLSAARDHKLRVFLIGSPRHQTIETVADTLRHRLPGIALAGYAPGLITPDSEKALRRQLLAAKPDLILVGIGFPLQEELMSRLAKVLPHGILVGEGGTFDYRLFGGRRAKAPRLLQTIGLEWLWRLALEPWRIKRQLAIPRFIWTIWQAGQKMASE